MPNDLPRCVQCADPAEVRFTFHPLKEAGGERIQQQIRLCGSCASMTWAKFKNTPAFAAATIEPVG